MLILQKKLCYSSIAKVRENFAKIAFLLRLISARPTCSYINIKKLEIILSWNYIKVGNVNDKTFHRIKYQILSILSYRMNREFC